MPALATDGPLTTLPNSASSSLDGPARKSHERTLGGVFAYTNGRNVETGLPDHKLEQLGTYKNNSLHSLTSPTPNGSIHAPRERAHSKTGSTHSIGSGVARAPDNVARSLASSDGLTKLSNVEHAPPNYVNGGTVVQEPEQDAEPPILTTSGPQASDTDPTATTPDTSHVDGQMLSPPNGQNLPLNRFSSPAAMSPGASYHDRHAPHSVDPPRLVHRHTLQLPRAPPARPSRDFSFSGQASEEALSATGRLSPTHDSTVTHRHRRASLGLVRRSTRTEAHLDEVVPDEDALRWSEMIRAKRASRRRRREEEEEDDGRVLVGKKVEEGHVNWVTAYNMLTGIRFTVSRTNAKIDRELTDADFTARHKLSFDITGNELTPSAKYDFKFKDYSPWVFRRLRAIFGLDPADYLMSLTSKYILTELGSPGKSGSFFYFSRDYKYIIKTIHHAEHKLLRRILKEYYHHVLENPNTLISQFYGLHRVKIPYGRKIHFVVMNNLFPPHRDIHQMYDLKGSTVGRDYNEDQAVNNPRATLKDLNWLRREMHLEFDDRIKAAFLRQMTKDVALLQKLKIMDYSLLVGIHDLEKGNEENLRENTLKVFQPGGERADNAPDHGALTSLTRTPSRLENARKARELRMTLRREKPVPMGTVKVKMPNEMSVDDQRQSRIFYSVDGGIRATHEDGRAGEEIYYLGIIDCLTTYGIVKHLEHFWKGLSADSTQISPIPPEQYGQRFINFITGITMTREEADRRHTLDSSHGNHGNQGTDVDGSRGLDGTTTSHPPRSPEVEETMRRAQRQVDKVERKRRRSNEIVEPPPEKTLGTFDTTPHTTLPVVEEAGDERSAGGRSGGSANQLRLPDPTSFDLDARSPSPGGIRQVSASTHQSMTEPAADMHPDDSRDDSRDDSNEKAPYLILPAIGPLSASPPPMTSSLLSSATCDPEKRHTT